MKHLAGSERHTTLTQSRKGQNASPLWPWHNLGRGGWGFPEMGHTFVCGTPNHSHCFRATWALVKGMFATLMKGENTGGISSEMPCDFQNRTGFQADGGERVFPAGTRRKRQKGTSWKIKVIGAVQMLRFCLFCWFSPSRICLLIVFISSSVFCSCHWMAVWKPSKFNWGPCCPLKYHVVQLNTETVRPWDQEGLGTQQH